MIIENLNVLPNKNYWSVTELTRRIRSLLENDTSLQNLWVTGEISNIANPSSGHLYFTLKDRTCSLRCVMWRSHVGKLPRLPQDGESIEIHGKVSVYEAGGNYQFYVDTIHSSGEGELFKEFLILKQMLQKEGLFEEERKRAIPKWPHRIGIVTSPTGAAYQDILKTIKRRYPLVEVVLSPTQVQGNNAPPMIKEAIKKLNQFYNPDVILLARGGGSIEDLWAFNTEIVARAIAESNAPIICGIGHETDFTISDFICDLRAPTPTAAAELATPNREDQVHYLLELKDNLLGEITKISIARKQQLSLAINQLRIQVPLGMINSNIQRVDILSQNLDSKVNHRLQINYSYLNGLNQKLFSLSPENILKRGFTILTKKNGEMIRNISQVEINESVDIKLQDGTLEACIENIQPEKENYEQK